MRIRLGEVKWYTQSLSSRKSKARSVWLQLCPLPHSRYLKTKLSKEKEQTLFSCLLASSCMTSLQIKISSVQNQGSLILSLGRFSRSSSQTLPSNFTSKAWSEAGWKPVTSHWGCVLTLLHSLRQNIDLVVKKASPEPIYVSRGLL